MQFCSRNLEIAVGMDFCRGPNSMFQTFISQPIYNFLIFLYNIVPTHDMGVAIILLTALVRAAFWPLTAKSIKAQKAMGDLQPKLEALKTQYKDDKAALTQATMELYKNEKINPLSSCLPLLIQLPILIGLYSALSQGLNSEHFDLLYPFIKNPGTLKTVAFGFLDLAKPSFVLALVAGLAQYWQTKMLPMQKPAVKTEGSKDEGMTAMINKQMLYMMPAMTVVIGASLPGGLTLYWLAMTLLTGWQQKLIFSRQ